MTHRNIAAAPGAEIAGGVYSHAERMRVIGGIIICILLAALDQMAVLPAIPQMARSLAGGGPAAAHLSWVVSAYLLTTTATTPIYGKLSDQLGRRAVLVPALALFFLACVVCAVANSVPMLILGRALQGIGGGALMSVSQAAVGDVVSPRERGTYQGWFAATWAFASIAGPVAGGFVVQHFSWRWIFWANLPLIVLAMTLCWRALAGLRPTGRRGRIDYLGAVLLLFCVSAVLLALSLGGVDFPWMSAPVLGAALAGAGGFALLWTQQRRQPEPLFPPSLLAHAGYRAVLALSFLNAAAMFAGLFLMPLLLQWVFHVSAGASGLDVMPFLFTTTVGAFTAGQIVRRTGKPRDIFAGAMGMSALAFLLLALLPLHGSIVLPVAVSAVAGAGMGAVMPTTLVAAQSQAAIRDIGAATGILILLRSLGGAFGATLGGVVLAAFPAALVDGFKVGFCFAAAMLAVAVVVAWRMDDFVLRGALEGTKAE